MVNQQAIQNKLFMATGDGGMGSQKAPEKKLQTRAEVLNERISRLEEVVKLFEESPNYQAYSRLCDITSSITLINNEETEELALQVMRSFKATPEAQRLFELSRLITELKVEAEKAEK